MFGTTITTVDCSGMEGRLPRMAALVALAAFAFVAGSTGRAAAQAVHGRGTLWIPELSVEYPGDAGVRAHTNFLTLIPYAGVGSLTPPGHSIGANTTGLPPKSGYFYETPASLACVYKLVSTLVAGCNPNSVTAVPTGGSKAIAIVDAYHDASAATDLAKFSTQFGLPAANFSVVYATGTKPSVDRTGGWELEELLDIEWAHAMAPGAKIYLVEAASNSYADLFKGVSVASSLVYAAGGGEVSMSWGGSEFSTETSYDFYLATAGVVYFASVGDAAGTEYPSVSPNVVAVGGTSTDRNPATGAFETEFVWQTTGGGQSTYETRPSYQNNVSATVGSQRGVPDVLFDADTATGVWVLDNGSWYIVGGTSVGAQALAGIVNAAGAFSPSSAAELLVLYNGIGGANFRDVASGNCGPYGGYVSGASWDFCTGIGSPIGLSGK